MPDIHLEAGLRQQKQITVGLIVWLAGGLRRFSAVFTF
jgi:hypothetical protein